MGLGELFVLAVGLSMDAFAVAVCKGLSTGEIKPVHAVITGLYFGSFQALMPLTGYLLGVRFRTFIVSIDHWIAFILLGAIGLNMIRGALSPEDEPETAYACQNGGDSSAFGHRAMLPLALATSIDALAVGVTFAFLQVDILPAVSFIGVITFLLSAAGVKVGSVFGASWKTKAELAGGVILILMGGKILIEHLFFS